MKSQFRALAVTASMFCTAIAFAVAPLPVPSSSLPPMPDDVAEKAFSPTENIPAEPGAKGMAPSTPAAKGKGKDVQVWADKTSKTYHCEGSPSYGKTKAGEYMPEAAAMANGYQGDKGKACTK